MTATEPMVDLGSDFSSPGAKSTPWTEACRQLEQAGVFWVSTVQPDGRPHVTPLIAVWLDDAIYFCTGPQERKAKNLAHNHRCVLTTGCNTMDKGLDVVIEGEAVRVRDDAKLQGVAAAYVAKYGSDWTFTVRDGTFHHPEGGPEHQALVFEVAPTVAFSFGKGDPFSQTRYKFAD